MQNLIIHVSSNLYCICFTGCLTVLVIVVDQLRQLGNYKLPQMFSTLKKICIFRSARKVNLTMLINFILNIYLKKSFKQIFVSDQHC